MPVVILEVDPRSPIAICRLELESSQQTSAFLRHVYLVTVIVTLQYSEHTAKEPNITFVIELNQSKNIGPIEVIAFWPILLPPLPFNLIARPYVQRLMLAVPPCKVAFVFSGGANQPDVAEQDGHATASNLRISANVSASVSSASSSRLRMCSLAPKLNSSRSHNVINSSTFAMMRICSGNGGIGNSSFDKIDCVKNIRVDPEQSSVN
jgi:hypothetical protein